MPDTRTSETRRRTVNTTYPSFYDSSTVSHDLYVAVKDAGAISVFQQPKEKVTAWARKLPTILQDEIICLGLVRAISATRVRLKEGVNGHLKGKARRAVKYQARVEKAKAFDRIVERLDLTDVNGKLLGDCTRPDLLRAAVQAEEKAGAATLDAAMFRQLAEIVGNGTVREASNRGKVVALLTTRYDTEN